MAGDPPITVLPAGTGTTGAEVSPDATPSTVLNHEFGDEFDVLAGMDQKEIDEKAKAIADGKNGKREDLAKKTDDQHKDDGLVVDDKKPEPKKEEVEEDIIPKVDPNNLPPVATSTTVVDDKGKVLEPDVQITQLQTQYENLKKEFDVKVQEVEGLKAVQATLEEIKRDPHAFISRFVPEVAARIAPQDIVVQTLKKEFSAEEIASYNMAEALEEGTISYKIRQREDAIREQVQRSRLEGESTRRDEVRKREARLSESKEKVKKEYGLTDAQFDQEIVNWAKNHPIDFYDIARLRYFDWHQQKTATDVINRRKGKQDKIPSSVASVSGSDQGSETASKEFREFRDEFGD